MATGWILVTVDQSLFKATVLRTRRLEFRWNDVMDVGRVGAVLAKEGITLGPTLGEGTYARVFAAEVRGQAEARAVKVIDLTRLPKQVSA